VSKRRQFHVLDGVLRDILAAFTAEGDDEAWDRIVTFARIIGDLLEVLETEDSDLPDSDEPAQRQLELDVGLRDVPDGSPMGGPDAGHAPDGSPPLVGPAGLESEMVRRARELAEAGARGTRQPLVPTGVGRRLVSNAHRKGS